MLIQDRLWRWFCDADPNLWMLIPEGALWRWFDRGSQDMSGPCPKQAPPPPCPSNDLGQHRLGFASEPPGFSSGECQGADCCMTWGGVGCAWFFEYGLFWVNTINHLAIIQEVTISNHSLLSMLQPHGSPMAPDLNLGMAHLWMICQRQQSLWAFHRISIWKLLWPRLTSWQRFGASRAWFIHPLMWIPRMQHVTVESIYIVCDGKVEASSRMHGWQPIWKYSLVVSKQSSIQSVHTLGSHASEIPNHEFLEASQPLPPGIASSAHPPERFA